MHYTKDYSQSPAKSFDAVNDIKDWLGPERWDKVSAIMRTVVDHNQFAIAASFAGVHGFPVKAWYELYHGEGSWIEPIKETNQ